MTTRVIATVAVGARSRVARATELTPNQAFAHGGRRLGLQFHIEAGPACIERWLIGHTCELATAGIDVTRLRPGLKSHLPDIARKSQIAIDAWVEAVEAD